MYKNTDIYDYNPDDIELIPEVQRAMSACAINIAPRGTVRLNERL